jgi:uncharacterized protein (DUF488 family)
MSDSRAGGLNEPILTIGHSTRSLDELTARLRAHDVTVLTDVRTRPCSARHPQFDRDRLAADLADRGVAYVHLPALGGLRKARPDSVNLGLRNPGFRGFADHMQTADFEAGLTTLIDHSRRARTAIMCAEADPRHCHRSLIADALTMRGVVVIHLVDANRAEPHALHPRAREVEGRVVYPL